MKTEQRIKYLIGKFVKNNCSSKEVDEIVAYFKKGEVTEEFLQVEDILLEVKEFPEMDKNSSQKIFRQILKKTERQGYKSRGILNRNKNIIKYAVAAVCIGLLTSIIYFTSFQNDFQEKENSIAIEEVIILETNDGKKRELSEQGRVDLFDEEGNIIGGQTGNQLVYENTQTHSEELIYNTLKIPYGKRFEILLSDGSTVFLNAGSSLKYPINFSNTVKREVFLTGEAFFKVAKNKDQPFIVSVENLEVEVLGTEFNVTAYPDDQAIRTVLVEGSVQLLDTHSENNTSVILKPEYEAIWKKVDNQLVIERADIASTMAWMNGQLIFREVAFKDILRKLERSYNYTIINENQALNDEIFTATFNVEIENIEQVMTYISKNTAYRYTISKNRIITIN